MDSFGAKVSHEHNKTSTRLNFFWAATRLGFTGIKSQLW